MAGAQELGGRGGSGRGVCSAEATATIPDVLVPDGVGVLGATNRAKLCSGGDGGGGLQKTSREGQTEEVCSAKDAGAAVFVCRFVSVDVDSVHLLKHASTLLRRQAQQCASVGFLA